MKKKTLPIFFFSRKWPYGGGSDSKGSEIGDGSDGDADSSVPHCSADLNGQRSLEILLAQVAVALSDDKHVVDADAQQQERQNRVHGAVKDAQSRAETERDQDGHTHRCQSHHRQESLTSISGSEQFQSSFRAISRQFFCRSFGAVIFGSLVCVWASRDTTFSRTFFRAVSEQFQSSFRAVSEQFQSRFRIVLEQFFSDKFLL